MYLRRVFPDLFLFKVEISLKKTPTTENNPVTHLHLNIIIHQTQMNNFINKYFSSFF